MRPTSGTVGQGRERNRVPVANGDGLHVGDGRVLLQLLGPFEDDLVIAVVASDEQEVGLLGGLLGLAEDVLGGGRLVEVDGLDDDIENNLFFNPIA